MDPRIFSLLKDIPLFSSIGDEKIYELIEAGSFRKISKNTIIINEGDNSDSLFIICGGKVKVMIHDNEGREIILSLLGEGDYFGEMSLLDGEPRSACVMTKEPTRLLMINKEDFKNICLNNKELAFNLIKDLMKRLREANKKIESLAFLDVYGRVSRLLLQLAKPNDGPDNEKSVINERLTHQEIANMVGSSREMVSRILKKLSTEGYITIKKKQITIEKRLPYIF
jgi:CRP/FNR family cyclic AMP-dependent transcriptional regulator